MSIRKPPVKTDPIDAAFTRARRELEQLGSLYRASLEADAAFHDALVALRASQKKDHWWRFFSNYELGLTALQRFNANPGHEYIAFLLIATDNLHESWNGSRPCGTEDKAFSEGQTHGQGMNVYADDVPF